MRVITLPGDGPHVNRMHVRWLKQSRAVATFSDTRELIYQDTVDVASMIRGTRFSSISHGPAETAAVPQVTASFESPSETDPRPAVFRFT